MKLITFRVEYSWQPLIVELAININYNNHVHSSKTFSSCRHTYI